MTKKELQAQNTRQRKELAKLQDIGNQWQSMASVLDRFIKDNPRAASRTFAKMHREAWDKHWKEMSKHREEERGRYEKIRELEARIKELEENQ